MNMEEVGEALAAKVKAVIDPLREETKQLRVEVNELRERIAKLEGRGGGD